MLAQMTRPSIDLLPVELFNTIVDFIETRKDELAWTLVSTAWYHRLVTYVPIKQSRFLLKLLGADPFRRLEKEPHYLYARNAIKALCPESGLVKTYALTEQIRLHAQIVQDQFGLLDKIEAPILDDESDAALQLRKIVEIFARVLYPDVAVGALQKFLPPRDSVDDLKVKIATSYCELDNIESAEAMFKETQEGSSKTEIGSILVPRLLRRHELSKAVDIAEAVPSQLGQEFLFQAISRHAVRSGQVDQLIHCISRFSAGLRSRIALAAVMELLSVQQLDRAIELLSQIVLPADRHIAWAYIGGRAIHEQQFGILAKAQEEMENASEDNRNEAFQLWSSAFLSTGDIERALNIALLVTQSPARAYSLMAIGKRYISLGRPDLVEALVNHVRDRVLSSRFWRAMGYAWAEMQEFKGAFRALKKDELEYERGPAFKAVFQSCLDAGALDIAGAVIDEESNPVLKEWCVKIFSAAKEQYALRL